MWPMIISAAASVASKAMEKGPMASASGPTNMTNGGIGYDSSNWTVATGNGKATASVIPDFDPKTIAIVGLVGAVLWKIAKKR